MKLDKQQVQALAEKIARELNNEVDKSNKEMKDMRGNFFKKKLSLKENRPIKELYDYLSNNSYNRSYIVSFIEDKYKSEYEKLPKESNNKVSQDQIRSEIILETIECENLEEIINKIKSKYEKVTNGTFNSKK